MWNCKTCNFLHIEAKASFLNYILAEYDTKMSNGIHHVRADKWKKIKND